MLFSIIFGLVFGYLLNGTTYDLQVVVKSWSFILTGVTRQSTLCICLAYQVDYLTWWLLRKQPENREINQNDCFCGLNCDCSRPEI